MINKLISKELLKHDRLNIVFSILCRHINVLMGCKELLIN